MITLNCPSCGHQELSHPHSDADHECPRCSDFMTDTGSVEHAGLPASPALESFAAALAGIVVMSVSGTILGRLAADSWHDQKVLFGALIGAVLGLIAGRKIAQCRTVLSGALTCAVIPFALCLLDAIRSGRIKHLRPQEFQEPRFWLIAAGIFGGGALLGGLLVATRKMLVRLTGRTTAEA
jgi:hypothetical protein